MEKFVKKRNLGLLFGIIAFVIVFLFSFYQSATNKALNKKADKIINEYANAFNNAFLSIDASNVNEKKAEVLSVIDKYWEDVDGYSSAFADKDTYHLTKSDFKKEIESFFEKPDLPNISMYQSDITCYSTYQYKPNCFDFDCDIESDFIITNNDTGFIDGMTLFGKSADNDSQYFYSKVTMKKINGSWKIIGVTETNNR